MGDVVQKVISENNYINGGSVSSTNMFGDSAISSSQINDNTGIAAMTGVLDTRFDDLHSYQGDGVSASVILEHLWMHLDAGDTDSYPGTGTIWYDSTDFTRLTGQGFQDTEFILVNGPVYSSDGGGSFSFDGTDDYAKYDNSVHLAWPRTVNGTNLLNGSPPPYTDPQIQVTFETWIRFDASILAPTTPPFYKWTIIGGYRYQPGGWHKAKYTDITLFHDYNGARTHVSIPPNGPYYESDWSLPWSSDVWYHIAMTRDADGVLRQYRNGVDIGGTGATSSNWFGQQDWIPVVGVDEISVAIQRVYGVGFTPEQVLNNYDAQKTRFGH